MRYFLDTEFNEDGRVIELISIALVAEDGREFYAVSSEFKPADCNEFVRNSVLPLLPYVSEWETKQEIRDRLRSFIPYSLDPIPEFWGYFCDYDWVVISQLFGAMVKLPETWPKFCRDLKQDMIRLGVGKDHLPKQEGAAHDALSDAQWIAKAHTALDKISVEKTGFDLSGSRVSGTWESWNKKEP